MKLSLSVKTLYRSPVRTILTFILLAATAFALFSAVAEYAISSREMEKAAQIYRGVGAVEAEPANSDSVQIGNYVHTDPRLDGLYELGEYIEYVIRYRQLAQNQIDAVSQLPYISSIGTRYMTAGVSGSFKRLKDPGGSMIDFRPTQYSGWFVAEGTVTDARIEEIDYTQYGLLESLNQTQSVFTIDDIVFLSDTPSPYIAKTERFTIRNLIHEQTGDGSIWAAIDIVTQGQGGRVPVNTTNYIHSPDYADGITVGGRYAFVLHDVWPNLRDEPEESVIFGGNVLLGNFLTDRWCAPVQSVDGESGGYIETEKFKPLKTLIEIINSDLRTFDVVYTDDLGAITRFADGSMAINDGRALTASDTENKSQVCVISNEVAGAFGLSVGDELTLALGNELFEQYLPIGARALTHERYSSEVSTEVTLEIVGIYTDIDSPGNRLQKPNWSYSVNTVFVPKSLLPVEESTLSEHLFSPSEFSFTVDNAWDIEPFLEETAPMFESMGLTLIFNDSGWADIAAAYRDSARLSVINITVFAAAAFAAIWFTVYLFIGRKRQEYAIMRALGTQADRAAYTLAVPLAAVAVVSMFIGILTAGIYTTGNIAKNSTIILLGENSIDTSIPAGIAIACFAGLLLLTLLIALVLLRRLSAQSPLELLRGSTAGGGKTQKGRNKNETTKSKPAEKAERSVQPVFPAATITAASAPPGVTSGERGSLRFILRYVLKHMLRTAWKQVLTVLLAAILFTVAGQFAFLRNSYDGIITNTDITANLTGGIPLSIMHMIVNNPLVSDPYYEARAYVGFDLKPTNLAATNDIGRFTGETPEITFLDGYDISCFDKAGNAAVVGKSLAAERGFELGDTVDLVNDFDLPRLTGAISAQPETDVSRLIETLNIRVHVYTIVGTITTPSGKYDNTVFTPGHREAAWVLDVTEIKPADNYRIEEFVAWGESIEASAATILFVADTGKLEGPIKILRLLDTVYPGVLAAALLIGGFLCCLRILQSSKESAIMRVLGVTKRKTRAILTLEQSFSNIAGLILGFCAMFIYKGGALAAVLNKIVLFVVLYMLMVLICTIVCSALATRKSPLELLQTKE